MSFSRKTQSRSLHCTSSHVFVLSSNLWQRLVSPCLSEPGYFRRVLASILTNASQFGFVWCFLMFRSRLCIIGKDTRKIMCPFQCFISRDTWQYMVLKCPPVLLDHLGWWGDKRGNVSQENKSWVGVQGLEVRGNELFSLYLILHTSKLLQCRTGQIPLSSHSWYLSFLS